MKNLYKKNKKHNNGTGEWPKGLFILMAIGGAICVWLLKATNTHYLITIVVPVLILICYCGLAWKTTLFYIREDQIGDNAYYMGFLFTLSSLAYALWKFQTDQVDGTSDPADIIGSFGVALWSTIVGISLRVFFSQMRQDPQDIERDARAKIAHAASALSGDLYQASVSFNTYTRGLHQSVEEAFLQTKAAADTTVASILELSGKLQQVEAPDGIINRKINGVFGSLEEATTKLNKLAMTQTSSVETLIASSSQLVEGIKGLTHQIDQMKDANAIVSNTNQSIAHISNSIASLQGKLTEMADGFNVLATRQGDIVERIANHGDALEAQLERSRRYTEQTHDALTSMTKTLEEKLS